MRKQPYPDKGKFNSDNDFFLIIDELMVVVSNQPD